MLFSHQQKPLVRRQLHACNLLDVLRDHYKVHLAHVQFIRVLIDVTNRYVVTCQYEGVKDLAVVKSISYAKKKTYR